MGNSNSNDEPKEEIDIDTTNVGLWNMNKSEVSTIGARELLTIVVLVINWKSEDWQKWNKVLPD